MLVLFFLSFSFQKFSPYAFGFFVLLIRKSVCGQCECGGFCKLVRIDEEP